MPKQKDLKRLVRARMEKTGESYTTARLYLVKKPAEPIDYAKLAGMSDEKVKAATGCRWEKWVKALDHDGAKAMSHRDLARHIREKYGTPSWWTQTVAVGYERIRGLRARGQQRSGEWTVNKSKTIAASAARVFEQFAGWARKAKLAVRASRPGKSLRLTWEDGSPVDLTFVPKGEKTQTTVEHRKLRSKEDADRLRAYWGEQLAALAAMMK